MRYYSLLTVNIKQLLDEVEHDMNKNYYQNRGLCHLPKPKAEPQITQTRGFDNSWYHAKTEFNNCFIIHFSHNSSSETEAKRSAIWVTRKHWPPVHGPPVHGPPLRTGSVDYLRTGPRTTPTDPSTDHPPNKIKNKNKDFTYSLSNCWFSVSRHSK